MRLSALTYILIMIFSCSPVKNATMRSNELNGTWIPVKQEMGGTSLPNAVFEKQKLIIGDSTYIFSAESVDKGELKYANGKMDIYGKEGVNAGKHIPTIYKYENGQLSICYNLSGDSYPETFETKNKPAFFLSVFKKELVR